MRGRRVRIVATVVTAAALASTAPVALSALSAEQHTDAAQASEPDWMRTLRIRSEALNRIHGPAAIAVAADATARPADRGKSVSKQLRAAKAATAKYHSVKRAKKDGYVPEGECVASPAGAMGIHYVNRRLASNRVLKAKRPEMLLYLPNAHGKLRLVGVEYFVAAEDQEPPLDDSDRQRLFGRPVDGPMEGHAPGMPYHDDLHVWLWVDNPAGKFEQFNPALKCPS
jgi:hypothetical protein